MFDSSALKEGWSVLCCVDSIELGNGFCSSHQMVFPHVTQPTAICLALPAGHASYLWNNRQNGETSQ